MSIRGELYGGGARSNRLVLSFAWEFQLHRSAVRRIQLNLRNAAVRPLIDEEQRRLADKAEE